MLLPDLQNAFKKLTTEFDLIPEERKIALRTLAGCIMSGRSYNKKVSLNFICTHNSRRSLIAQIWAQTAAGFYSIQNVECYSGGTEATAFNPRAVEAMKRAGFAIVAFNEGANPIYNVFFSESAAPIVAFSKKYDDPFNRNADFIAVVTCSQADVACPFLPGSTNRIALTYDDPKAFDDTAQESEKYDERVSQIGREMLFAFSLVKTK